MLFNSIQFALFLPTVFLAYWFVFRKNLRGQNLFVIVASYVFYGWWDPRFLALIVISSGVDFFVGLQLAQARSTARRKLLLLVSILVNLGFLGFFKYFNFFVDSLIDAVAVFGYHLEARSLNIVLPVGISFYTFQTLSYTIDVYRKKLEPTRDIVAFFAFVAFFPQLVAGPIERATNLLPQFYVPRRFDLATAKDGMRQVLWGLFKKIVVADTCAVYANQIFESSEHLSGGVLILGTLYFAFQIYGDFSGYSDIAIGTAKLFGFKLMTNFRYPYFSRDIAEFWRRWHISLSTWFRDYLYIPLGGSRGSLNLKLRNTMIIFVVSGFWHGANWTFIVWGFLNGLYFLPLLLRGSNRTNLDVVAQGRLFPNLREVLQVLATFCMTLVAWVFFRAESVSHAITYLAGIFSSDLLVFPVAYLDKLPLVALMLAIEWPNRDKQHPLQCGNWHPLARYAVYFGLFYLIAAFVSSDAQEFIYFQF